jgi:hypothetical protein
MKLQPYETAIKLSPEEQEASMAPARAAEAEAQLGLKLAKLSIEKKSLENRVTEAGGTYPINFDRIVEYTDDLALLERQEVQLKAIGAQLFPKS